MVVYGIDLTPLLNLFNSSYTEKDTRSVAFATDLNCDSIIVNICSWERNFEKLVQNLNIFQKRFY